MSASDLTALIVALVALVISLLQLVQQYASSATARGKVNTAAIGGWAAKNHYRWNWREWKLRVYYARPSLTAKQVITWHKQALKSRLEHVAELSRGGFTATEHITVAGGAHGLRAEGGPKLMLYRAGTENQKPVSPASLPRRHRAAASALQDSFVKSSTRPHPCKATWCNLMNDLGFDLRLAPGEGMLDADVISSSLDAPTMEIRLSDVICCGFLLDMTVVTADPLSRIVAMTGDHCNITTRHHSDAGLVTRYSGMAHGELSPINQSNPLELDMLLNTARGYLQVGDSLAPFTDFGYNSTDMLFDVALSMADGMEWQQITLGEIVAPLLEGDSHVRWSKKWINPFVPVVPFLLAICSNMGVANAFPHEHLSSWTTNHRSAALLAAFDIVDKGSGVVLAPVDLLKVMKDTKIDILVMDNYKTVNNWGCEYGGMRGWLTTSLAEFTLRISKCWTVEAVSGAVPILPQLIPFLSTGTLDCEWGKNYNLDPDEGHHWRMTTNSLLWLQIMMLDTWIAHRVDIIMGGGGGIVEVSVPAVLETAERCARAASQLAETTAWKPARLKFTRHYLKRLAEGVDGKGASCMSTLGDRHGPGGGWGGMAEGKLNDWIAVDAVLTLRAVLMATRLEMMKDSSILWQLRRLDPVVTFV